MRYGIVIGKTYYFVDVYPLEERLDITTITKTPLKEDFQAAAVIFTDDPSLTDEELILKFIQKEDPYGYRIKSIRSINNDVTKLYS